MAQTGPEQDSTNSRKTMKIRVLKLGTVCTEKATGLKGTITHWLIDMGQRIDYLFQPNGLLNPEDGMPVKKIMLAISSDPSSSFNCGLRNASTILLHVSRSQ